MRLGISTYTYGWRMGVPGAPAPASPLTIEGLLHKAAQLGVHVVQIADNPALPHMSDADLAALRDTAARLQIDLEVGTRGIEPAHLRRYAAVAGLLNARLVRTIIAPKTPAASSDETVESLRAIVSAYAHAGLCLAIENHERHSAAVLAEIVTRLDCPHIGICLDTANSIGCLEGLDTLLRVLGRWIVNLHVKDVRVRRLANERGFVVEGCPAGQGQVDIPWVLREVRERGCCASAILESWTPAEATIAESIAKEEAWVGESIRYLRGLIPD